MPFWWTHFSCLLSRWFWTRKAACTTNNFSYYIGTLNLKKSHPLCLPSHKAPPLPPHCAGQSLSHRQACKSSSKHRLLAFRSFFLFIPSVKIVHSLSPGPFQLSQDRPSEVASSSSLLQPAKPLDFLPLQQQPFNMGADDKTRTSGESPQAQSGPVLPTVNPEAEKAQPPKSTLHPSVYVM